MLFLKKWYNTLSTSIILFFNYLPMKTVNTDLVERIISLNEKVQKFAEVNVFKNSWITLSQFSILWELIENKLKTINELKATLLVSPPALSQILWRMELSGLVSREINKLNKRETNLIVSKKAVDLYNKISKEYSNLTDKKFASINDSKKQDALKLLKEIEETVFSEK